MPGQISPKMKKSVVFLFVSILSLAFFLSYQANATGSGKVEEIKIKTSAKCGMCKEKIEETLAFEKGVKSAILDVETKIVTVKYDPAKTDPLKIKTAISKAGYDADEVKKDPKAYEKLPKCYK